MRRSKRAIIVDIEVGFERLAVLAITPYAAGIPTRRTIPDGIRTPTLV
jgi:hypothetical protein